MATSHDQNTCKIVLYGYNFKLPAPLTEYNRLPCPNKSYAASWTRKATMLRRSLVYKHNKTIYDTTGCLILQLFINIYSLNFRYINRHTESALVTRRTAVWKTPEVWARVKGREAHFYGRRWKAHTKLGFASRILVCSAENTVVNIPRRGICFAAFPSSSRLLTSFFYFFIFTKNVANVARKRYHRLVNDARQDAVFTDITHTKLTNL